jgi:hypothetical protein
MPVVTEAATVEQFRITEGAEYLFASAIPPGCKGHRYRVIGFLKEVPSGQQKVLVQALTGPDTGLRFSCTLANFATRYQPAPEVQP